MRVTRLTLVVLGCVPVLLNGCATKLYVTYNSDPPGATLYQGPQSFGVCPATLVYRVSKEDKKSGYKNLQGTSVRWISGAEASLSSLNANLSLGYHQQFTFVRPQDAAGREMDVQYAIHLQQVSAFQAEARRQREAEALRQYNDNLERQREQQQQQMQQQTQHQLNCTSTTDTFGTTHTNCY